MIDWAGRAASPFATVFRRGTKYTACLVTHAQPGLPRGGTYFARHALILCLALSVIPFLRSQETSELAPLAAHALLLDAVNTGDKIVAVGDHGNVVISRDNGLTWTQSITPTRVLLTAVSFPDPQHGWAVGHNGVILATSDGGATWQRQDDGKGLETVLLDVRFLSPSTGFAVGAYGKFLTTSNGGKLWTPGKPAEEEVHYNRINAGSDGELYLAGESGTLLISQDTGKKWTKANVPYDGSLFGTLPLENGGLIVYGLRGHIFRSEDHGVSWEPQNSEIKVLIMSGIRLKSGVLLLAGQGGNFFVSRDSGHTFEPWKLADFGTSVAGLVEANDGAVITVGEAGAVRIKFP